MKKQIYKQQNYNKLTGIYGIFVGACLVYVGQAKNVYSRKRQHWRDIYKSNENKYQLLRAAAQYFKISFYLLEKCDETELDKLEEKWIKGLRPCLNSKFNENRGREITFADFVDEVANSAYKGEKQVI